MERAVAEREREAAAEQRTRAEKIDPNR